MKILKHERSYWLELADRYFEAETTDDEERLLRRFAASDAAQDDPDFAPLLAVMSLVSCSKPVLHAVTTSRQKTVGMKRHWLWPAAAACIASIAFLLYLSDRPRQDVCVAYVDGQKITDREQVILLMHRSWDDIGLNSSTTTIETQLTDLFNTLE